MNEDNHVLGRPNAGKLGQSFVVDPGVAVGGEVQIIRDLKLFNLNAQEQWSPKNISMIVNSVQLDAGSGSDIDRSHLLYGTIGISLASTLFGVPQDALGPLIVTPLPYTHEILFDLNNGALLTLPAVVGFSAGIRYVNTAYGGVFAAGEIVGPRFRINAGLSYGTTKLAPLQKTDPYVLVPKPAPGLISGANFARPQFAKSVQFQFSYNPTVAAPYQPTGYVLVSFITPNLVNRNKNTIIFPYTLGEFPIFQYPQDTIYATIYNITDNDLEITAVHNLVL